MRHPLSGSLASVFAVAFLFTGCGDPDDSELSRVAGESRAPLAAADSIDGPARMVAALRRIKEDTGESNHWLGDRDARISRGRLASLPSNASPLQRFQLTMAVAEHELRLGNLEAAVARFEGAYLQLAALEGVLSDAEKAQAIFRLGVAHLRDAETRNCAQDHSGESCILPIRGAGLHSDPQGSESAIRYFLEVLRMTPPASPVHLKSLWLMNLAYMTIGGYPDEVPADYRIPLHVFASDESFVRFENVAPALGLASFNLSGGAVFDDLDNDGYLDLFTTTFDTRGGPHFFHNTGDGHFVERTEEAGLAELFGGLNVVQADYDNDGDLDLYVLRGAWLYTAGRHPNSLLRNNGDGTFTDVTFDAGLAEEHFPTQTAAWADYDNDGDVDLFVGNEHGNGLEELVGEPEFDAPSQLFRNDDGFFVDVAREAGVEVRAVVKGVVWGDYDGNRFPDLYVSVLGGRNRLFHNRGDGSFVDVAEGAGVAEPENSFPVWFWDYDNDGHLDLYVSSYRGSRDSVALVAASYFGAQVPWDLPRLYKGDGRGGFADVSAQVHLTRLHLPMGSNFGDIDNDGYLDFYLGTGYPDYEALMPNVLYRNRRGERFSDITWAGGFGHLQKGHGVAFADFDHDGDQDLFAQMGGAFPGDGFNDALFENPGFGHRWLTLHLVGTTSNRAAIGARIRVAVVEEGRKREIYRHVTSGGSFGCNPLRQTIGLGNAGRIEEIEIYWPTSDLMETFEQVEMDRFYRVTEGEKRLEELSFPLPRAGAESPDFVAEK